MEAEYRKAKSESSRILFSLSYNPPLWQPVSPFFEYLGRSSVLVDATHVRIVVLLCNTSAGVIVCLRKQSLGAGRGHRAG